MIRQITVLFYCTIFYAGNVIAQHDTTVANLQHLPAKYIAAVDGKVTSYTKRITGKTTKTLRKLAKWESKIQQLLQKADPATAQQLFANPDLTFAGMLQKYEHALATGETYKARYDDYRDKLTTQFKYLETKQDLLTEKQVQQIASAKDNLDKLNKDADYTEALQQMIQERKKELIKSAVAHIGKSKYLQNINKESYYYVETLRNYKEIFNDKKKAEETAVTLLNKIPAFKKFMRENSMLASLFRVPADYGSAQSLAGLQTRASVNNLIQNRIAAGGPNAMADVQQNIQAAQAQINALRDKLLKVGGGNTESVLPNFKPNMQKTKTFLQRMEFGTNFQTIKGAKYLPGGMNIGLSAGYKLNDKSTFGIGASYRMGLSSNDKIRISHEGIGLRSFIDWKLKKQFFVSGGFEMNYHASFKNIAVLDQENAWQRSGLLGISKKIPLKTKYSKGTKVQLLYDFLHNQHVPVSQPIIFRVGYDLK